LKQLANENI